MHEFKIKLLISQKRDKMVCMSSNFCFCYFVYRKKGLKLKVESSKGKKINKVKLNY